MTASLLHHPAPTARIFQAIEAVTDVSAVVQPDRTRDDFTHVITATSATDARTIAALLLIAGTVTTVEVIGPVARVVVP